MSKTPTVKAPNNRQEAAYRFDAGQHADVSGEVCGLEDGLVVPLEVQVHHQRLQLLSNDPRLVLGVPAAKTTDASGERSRQS